MEDGQYSLEMNVILKTHSKRSTIQADVLNLLLAMAYPIHQVQRKSFLKNVMNIHKDTSFSVC